MKKILLTIFILLLSCTFAQDSEVYSYKNKFGLQKGDQKLTEPVFTKLIRLRDTSYLFCYKGKYGIISKDGDILVEAKYTQANRFISKFAKLGYGGKYAIFDENGDMILDREYSSIDLLYGGMFLVGKNYKYGLVGFDGDIILAPVADDIYMPERNILKVRYDGSWYTIEQKDGTTIQLPDDILAINNDSLNVVKIIEEPIASTGYGLVSASDYLIKIFSSISPAYEQTIDELVLDHGADTASILLKSSWLVKFPFVYTKNYFATFKTPNNGPLSDVKTNLRRKITR